MHSHLPPLKMSIGYTLIDISKTNEVSGHIDNKARNQQRNWETLVQVLGLRAQLIILSNPRKIDLDVSRTRFGNSFTGIQAIWSFQFGVEEDAVYANNHSSHGTLASDFTNIPIITGLDETAPINVPMFMPIGEYCNIYFATFET